MGMSAGMVAHMACRMEAEADRAPPVAAEYPAWVVRPLACGLPSCRHVCAPSRRTEHVRFVGLCGVGLRA